MQYMQVSATLYWKVLHHNIIFLFLLSLLLLLSLFSITPSFICIIYSLSFLSCHWLVIVRSSCACCRKWQHGSHYLSFSSHFVLLQVTRKKVGFSPWRISPYSSWFITMRNLYIPKPYSQRANVQQTSVIHNTLSYSSILYHYSSTIPQMSFQNETIIMCVNVFWEWECNFICSYICCQILVTTSNLDGLYLYRNTFSMPGTDWPMSGNKLWFSFDVGQVHFLV